MAYKGSLFQVLNDDGTVQGELVFDAIVSEGHSIDNIITEFPVDSGFIVSDHVIRRNRTLLMEVVSVRHAFKDRQNINAMTSGSDNKPSDDFHILTELVQKGARCNVITILGIYTNCVVTSFKTKQDVNTSTILKANLVLKELNVVGVDPSASRDILIKAAEEVNKWTPDPELALKKLLGYFYDNLEGASFADVSELKTINYGGENVPI